jgi:hypothetical protein
MLAGALGVAGTAALAGPAGAGMASQGPFTVDGQIKLKGVTGFVGDNLYDTPDAVGQVLSTFASPSDKAIFVVRAENEKFNKKNRIEMWVDEADCEGSGEIKLFYQGQDVTEEMFVDDLDVGGVPPGGHVDVRLKIKVGPGVECFAVIGVASDKFPGGADYVVADVISTQPGGIIT